MVQPVPDQPTEKKRSKRSKIALKRIALVVFAAAIFILGLNIGSGRITFSNQTGVQKNLPNKLDYTSVNELYRALKANFDGELDTTKLTDGMKQGLVKAAGDPYTEYLSAAEYKDFNDQLSGSFTGIGAELSQGSDGSIVIVSPIAGFPAEKAGLKPKDVIVEIDGTSTAGMTVSEAVQKIRGPKDSSVKLKIIRGSTPVEVTIVRQDISIPSVNSKVENGIGYLTISRFGEDTASLAKAAAEDFKQQNVKGVVVDVRSNPGGLLDAAVSVSSLWLPKGTTVLTERRDGLVTNTFKAEGGDVLKGIPTVVLIDGGSASASEILAGALKDNGAASLVGEKSYGKGSVQQLIKLDGGGVLKVTIARWFTPGGKNIDKAGIEPDKKVTITPDDAKNGNDPQKSAATQQLSQ
ncbi:MAG: S41 family peptidase [Candidatus Saccharimonadales bacterium]